VDLAASEKSKRRRTEGEQIGSRVDFVATSEGLFGRHVRERSEGCAGARPKVRRAVVEKSGESEIEDFDSPLLREKEVLRLEISVDDSLGVSGDEDVQNLVEQAQHFARGDFAESARSIGDDLAFEQFHREIRGVGVGAALVDRYHPGMADPRHHFGFEEKTLTNVASDSHFWVEQLDRRSATFGILCRVNGCHPACTKEVMQRPATPHGLSHSAR
jgi:hypothetical protein